MKNVPITCAGCGKTYQIAVEDLEKVDQHTFVAKCACGATTQIEGTAEDASRFEDLSKFLKEIPKLLQEFRQSRAKGVDTGIGEAVGEMSKELALQILKSDEKLRGALQKMVREDLEAYLMAADDESQGTGKEKGETT